MGNKLCKRKSDSVDNSISNSKSPSQFDRIINRLHIRPNSWKSDPQLNQKQVKRLEKTVNEKQNNVITSKPLSKSSEWTEVDLRVPDKEEHVHLTNPKTSLIFNNDKGTPVPPPRKHKKNLREKIEAVAKSGLQALQPKKPVEDPQPLKPVEEVAFVKKTINYKCPICDEDESTHNRDHHHHHLHHHHPDQEHKNQTDGNVNKAVTNKDKLKNKKTLSVSSLPNYDELKLTVAEFDESDKGPLSLSHKTERKANPSQISLPTDAKKSTTASSGKLDTYITRCRSFGSLFPQQLKKLRPRKVPADIESDDSFGGLEDWDLGLIEHYNPKDASLPRPSKPKRSDDRVLADIESLIVKEEDIEPPKPPIRRVESLVKKENKELDEVAHKSTAGNNNAYPVDKPFSKPKVVEHQLSNELPKEEDSNEHSSLIKILQKFSMAEKEITKDNTHTNGNESSFEKNILNNTVENDTNKFKEEKIVEKKSIMT